MNEQRKCGLDAQWNIFGIHERRKSCPMLQDDPEDIAVSEIHQLQKDKWPTRMS